MVIMRPRTTYPFRKGKLYKISWSPEQGTVPLFSLKTQNHNRVSQVKSGSIVLFLEQWGDGALTHSIQIKVICGEFVGWMCLVSDAKVEEVGPEVLGRQHKADD